MLNQQKRVWGLDLLRAAAVVGVLLSHFPYHTGVNLLQKVFPIGPVMGVEIFFVLSGFLIGQILVKEVQKTDFDFGNALNFMKRRWYRTLPNYYLYLLVMLVLQWNIGKHHIFEFVFFLQNLITKPVAGFYGVTWSLTIEEIFYFSFPISLVAFGFFIKDRRLKLLACVTLFILLPLFIRLFVYGSNDFDSADFRKGAIIRLDSIAYGVLMAYIKVCVPKFWNLLSRQGIFLILPLWYFFFFNYFPALGQESWANVYFPLMSATVALTLPFFDSIKEYKGLISVPVTFIALISYSLYLCHIPVIIVSNNFMNINEILSGHVLEIYYIIVSVIVAFLTYLLWEGPMTRLRDKF